MGFFFYLLYLSLAYLRLIELFAPELMSYRPMVVIWALTFMSGVLRASKTKSWAFKGAEAKVLLMLVLSISISKLLVGGFGSAIDAFSDFSATAWLFVLTGLHVTDTRRLKTTCGVLLLCTLFLCGLSAYSFHAGYRVDELITLQPVSMERDLSQVTRPPIPADDDSGAYLYRVHGVGFFNDPNDFAQAIVSMMPALWFLFSRGRNFRNLLMVWAPGAFMAYVIYLTHSRGAIVGFASMLFFGMRQRLGAVKTGILLAVGGIAVLAGSFMGGRDFSSKEESAEGRIEAWAHGLQMVRENPLFGVGYGEFSSHHIRTAHNSFVLGFSELGLVGYFFWIGLLVIAYKAVSDVVQEIPATNPIAQMAVLLRSALIGFLTCAWFLSRTYQPTLYVLLALCCAVRHCAWNELPKGDALLRQPPKPWSKTTLIMGGLSMLTVHGFIVMHYR